MKCSVGSRVVLSLAAAVILLAAGYAALPVFFNDSLEKASSYDISPLVLYRNGEIMTAYLSASQEWSIPVSIDKMGAWTQKAAVAIEDKRFFDHSGIDLIAIARALFSNVKAKRVVSGASTITAQLVRIFDPRPRTYKAKISEFMRALVIERKMSKPEILELYLNRAPFGGNLRGIEAASIAYFGKSAGFLSLGESTLLLSILKAPSHLRPDRFPDTARRARDKNLRYLASRGIITDTEAQMALSEPVTGKRNPFPKKASMAALHAKKETRGETMVTSSIDIFLQTLLEKKIAGALLSVRDQITASGIILDNASGEVLAYVGNGRHGTSLPGAQFDCGAAPRSSASTLKPFIYALAFEKGRLLPSSLLADTPLDFKGNAPRNFDMSYRGPVSARAALASSLNTPAVRVLRMAGYASSVQLLKSLGFKYLTEESSHYTDSLILGGCEVTLLELAAAYRALANFGQLAPLSWLCDSNPFASQAISPAASYMAADILQDTGRLAPIYQEIMKDKRHVVGFKTGTSYGLRDAWSIGFTASHTVGIWFGAPDGRGYDDLVGLRIATPLMLAVFKDIIKPDGPVLEAPKNVALQEFCALSGEFPGKYCPSLVTDYFISGVSKHSLCSLHKFSDGKLSIDWPDELKMWAYKNETSSMPNVKITRPARGSTVFISEGNTAKLFLSAEGNPPFYWYLDGKFLGIDKNGKGLLTDISKGKHKASILSGNKSDVLFFEVSDRLDSRFGEGIQILD